MHDRMQYRVLSIQGKCLNSVLHNPVEWRTIPEMDGMVVSKHHGHMASETTAAGRTLGNVVFSFPFSLSTFRFTFPLVPSMKRIERIQ